MDVLRVIVLCLLIGVIVYLFVRYLISINKGFSEETDQYIKQKKVQGNMSFYGCENEGESLDDCEIYSVPYETIGYKDVK